MSGILETARHRGQHGEDMAVRYVAKRGFEIVERNYRYGRGEVDIIGILDNELLVFFEVKLRKNADFGEPETFVSPRQEKLIMAAADEYILAINWHKDIRFDILSICGERIEHIEDAFH